MFTVVADGCGESLLEELGVAGFLHNSPKPAATPGKGYLQSRPRDKSCMNIILYINTLDHLTSAHPILNLLYNM